MARSTGVAVSRLALAAGLGFGGCPAALAGAGLTQLTEQPLPVAVRDGDVAEVTVRAIPFALGTATLDGPTATALGAYLAAAATDCFLFAQAVGHVRPGAHGGGDTLAAHRLARARSETVSAALLRAGLPADAVTTVWDRQFTAREPRVTLWMFARPAGDDCSGAPLPGAAASVAVLAPPPAGHRPAMAPAWSHLEPAPGIHLPDPAPAIPGRAEVATAGIVAVPPFERLATVAGRPSETEFGDAAASRRSPDPAEPAPGIHLAATDPPPFTPAGPTRRAGETAMPAPSPSAGLAVAAAAPGLAYTPGATLLPEPKAGPASPAAAAPDTGPSEAPVPLAQIVFAPDSSYLPDGAEAQLAGLLARLPRDTTWEVELQAAIDDTAGDLPGDQAITYNRWLAERRQNRIEDWLGTQAGGPMLRMRRSTLPHDPSRRVVVNVRPLS